MPKNKRVKSALKRTRELLQTRQESETEEDSSSDNSEEYSHIPVSFDIPLLSSLVIEKTDQTEMDQIAMEINNLAQMLHALTEKQNEQQITLNSLLQNNAGTSNSQPRTQNLPTSYTENLFKIPDPIKSIPRYDGSRRQLSSWLTTAENTLAVFRGIVSDCEFTIYTTAVINKIEGKAKDIICLAGNPQSFEEVKEILVNALGDRQELTYYKSQLWQTKMDNMSLHKYYTKCKEIVQNIKSLAKQKAKYRENWDAINAFIEEDALAAFLAGLREPYFGLAQAAGPEDIEAAYAFVCKFRSREQAVSNIENFRHTKVQNKKDYKENTYKKPPYQKDPKTKPDHSEHYNDQPQPMEVGSVKSKLTLNRRQIHNNELTNDEKSSDSESEENIDLNFCWAQEDQSLT